MSTTARQAADAVGVLINQHRALGTLGDYLDGIASVEQVTQEVDAARDKAIAARDEALDAAADARARLVDAENAVDEAKGRAEAVKAQAVIQAERIVADAEAASADLVATAEAQVNGINAQIATAVQQRDALDEDIRVRRAELTSLNASIAAVKDAARLIVQ